MLAGPEAHLNDALRDMAPENDFPPTECRFRYIVCATKRSGSTLLCTGLASTGKAGRPTEYFSGPYGEAFRARTGRLWIPEYCQFLMSRRTSPNGVFGVKVHFDHLAGNITDQDAQKRWLAQFDRLIFLTRRDKLAQAISKYRADTTGLYRLSAEDAADVRPAPQVRYSFHHIAKALSIIATQEGGWRSLLGDFAEKTLSLAYEELEADYVGTVQRVLRWMGLQDAISDLDPRPRICPQRDDTSRAWTDRFLQDLFGKEPLRDAAKT